MAPSIHPSIQGVAAELFLSPLVFPSNVRLTPNMGSRQDRSAIHGEQGNGAGAAIVRYMECQRNHFAGTGRHVVDGCQGFMALMGVDEAAMLLCAACGCHRSFHRRVVVDEFGVDYHAPRTPPANENRR